MGEVGRNVQAVRVATVRSWGCIGGRKADFFRYSYTLYHVGTYTRKKRKIEDENRQFKEEWTSKYFMQHFKFNTEKLCA